MHRFLLTMMTLGGAFCMIASSAIAWFRIPVGATSTEYAELPIIYGAPSSVEGLYRVIAALIVLITGAIWYGQPLRRHWSVASAAAGLIVLLLFPHFQIAWQPTLSAQASWLQIQHENLTWLGGDIFRGQAQIPGSTQFCLYVSDSPRRIAVMELPSWSFNELGLHRLPSLIEWLGYTNTFCQFAVAGWPLAIWGNVLLLVGTLFDRQRISILRLRTAVHALVAMGLAGVAIAWFWPLQASARLARAAHATHRGNHAQAQRFLNSAARCWPPLKQDTWYVAQLGLAEHLLGFRSAHARLYAARMLEKDRQFALAVGAYRALVEAPNPESAVRREACRGLLRHSIRSLNSGQVEQAANGFRYVLRHEPCNIKALYGLHIVYRRLEDERALARVNAQLASVYMHLSFPDKRIVLGKSRELVAVSNKGGTRRPGWSTGGTQVP